MAFLPIMGELILGGIESGVASNIISAVYNEFEPDVKRVASDKLGNAIGDYYKQHPLSFVSTTLDKANEVKNSGLPPKSNHKKNHNRQRRRIG